MSETGHAASFGRPQAGPLPLLSIVVPLYNQLALTKTMLDSLLATLPSSVPFEIILVDDGSTDGTRGWLAGVKDPRMRVLLNESNLGFASANNRGAALARGEFLALLNNDLVLQPGWLEPMLEVFTRRGETAGIVGNLQLRVSDGTIDHAGIRATRDAKLVHIRRHPSPAPEGREVLAVTAACCLLRRAVFERLGGFDTAYVNGGEDVDLCLRLHAEGLLCLVAPTSTIHHHVSASRGPTSTKDERNSRRLFQKWAHLLDEAVAEAWCTHGSDSPPPAWTLSGTLFRLGLLRHPPRRARLLARSARHREESRWRVLLDGTAPLRPELLEMEGFCWDAPGSPSWIARRAVLKLKAGTPATNFFVCGHLTPTDEDGLPGQPLGLRICINDLESTEIMPVPAGDFNLPVDAPASLPDRPTKVSVELLGRHPFSQCAGLLIRLTWLPRAWRRRLKRHSLAHDGRRLRISALVADGQTVADLSHPPVG